MTSPAVDSVTDSRGAGETPVAPVVSDEFRRLFEEHASYAWNTLRRFGVRDEDRDDLVQEIFVTVHSLLEEYDRARWTLPPARIFFIGLILVGVVGALLLFVEKPRPPAGGVIGEIAAVEVPGPKSAMVLVLVNVHIASSQKTSFQIKEIHARLTTNDGEWTDEGSANYDYPQ